MIIDRIVVARVESIFFNPIFPKIATSAAMIEEIKAGINQFIAIYILKLSASLPMNGSGFCPPRYAPYAPITVRAKTANSNNGWIARPMNGIAETNPAAHQATNNAIPCLTWNLTNGSFLSSVSNGIKNTI